MEMLATMFGGLHINTKNWSRSAMDHTFQRIPYGLKTVNRSSGTMLLGWIATWKGVIVSKKDKGRGLANIPES